MTHHVQRPSTLAAHTVTAGSLAEALEWMSRPNVKPIAGGTDLMVELDRGEHREMVTLLDLTRIPELDQISEQDGTVTIGPLVTHNQCVNSEILRRTAPLLVQACWEVGSPQLRNRATVAGNVVTASPANDTLSALAALDAVITVASKDGRRQIPLSEFHLGVRKTALEAGELLTAISFPALGEDVRSVYLKLGLRRAQAISVVHLAAVARFVGSGAQATVQEVRLALGSVAPTIVRLESVEAQLEGASLDEATIAVAAEAAAELVNPIDDLRAPADYRRTMVVEMIRRALMALRDGTMVTVDEPALLWGESSGGHPTGPAFSAEHRLDSPVTATVNGSVITGPASGASLLDWLRVGGLTGVKEGCAEGECGSCTVDLDGLAVLSCLIPATRANGAQVTTIEGLASRADGPLDLLHPLQQAFVETGAVQCGFCIPGFLMSGSKLLEEFPSPTDDQIKAGLSGNLCRCTGYYKIEDAVRVALRTAGERA